MIYVYYVAGTFGSTFEYVLRSFTNEYHLDAKISNDGSMHEFKKFHHLISNSSYTDFFKKINSIDSSAIVTPVYPVAEGTRLQELLSIASPYFSSADKLILIYIEDITYAEINRLFQYHKILNSPFFETDLAALAFGNNTASMTRWNPSYTSMSDMQPWEIREWLSLIEYEHWFDGVDAVPDNFLKISSKDILNDTFNTFKKIIDWCGLSYNKKDLSDFASTWRGKQQYVIDEHNLITSIVKSTIENISLEIPANLNIFAQSVIQQKLRSNGYELACDGLNSLPTNTVDLHKLLIKDLIIHKENQ